MLGRVSKRFLVLAGICPLPQGRPVVAASMVWVMDRFDVGSSMNAKKWGGGRPLGIQIIMLVQNRKGYQIGIRKWGEGDIWNR